MGKTLWQKTKLSLFQLFSGTLNKEQGSTAMETGQDQEQEIKETSFSQEVEKFPSVDEKIRFLIDTMKAALAQDKSPNFKTFWDAKHLCLTLFKENMPPAMRAHLWTEYVELSDEAKKLKNILDEQTAFAIEQIELAIQAFEEDLKNYETLLGQLHEVEFPEVEQMQNKMDYYLTTQKELNLLNTFAARINSLRKEVMKMEMRIRHKNKLFKSLSSAGDQIFPRRKELIKQISSEFQKDIEEFVAINFSSSPNSPYYILRDDIKHLQNIAKILTLNTKCFTTTRLQLSKCWDQIRELDKERKHKMEEKRKVFEESIKFIEEKIEAFAKEVHEKLTFKEVKEKSKVILKEMQTVKLRRGDVRYLKQKILEVEKPFFEKEKKEKDEIKRVELEKKQKRQEEIDLIKQKATALLQDEENVDENQMASLLDEIEKSIGQLELTKAESLILKRLIKPIKDMLEQKREKSLISDEKKVDFVELKSILEKRKQRRVEIKQQLEKYRKALGGSGFDFEKAMMYREMIDVEKQRLDQANESIIEIEDKIAKLQKR